MTDYRERFDRNVRLFGAEGQQRLNAQRVLVAGVSGLGTPVVQHLALLGVGAIDPLDDEELDETNRNRNVDARYDDPIPGSLKVLLSARHVHEIDPSIQVDALDCNLMTQRGFEAVKRADWVFGCFDHDGPRSVLNELCAAYSKPLIDLASDVPESGVYGGRINVCLGGSGCLNCMDVLDRRDIRRFFEGDDALVAEDAVYGIDRRALDDKGPSVSPLNGIVAAMGVLEFMVAVTGLRAPYAYQVYRGEIARLTSVVTPLRPNCMVCKGVFGMGEHANIERYLQLPRFAEAN